MRGKKVIDTIFKNLQSNISNFDPKFHENEQQWSNLDPVNQTKYYICNKIESKTIG